MRDTIVWRAFCRVSEFLLVSLCALNASAQLDVPTGAVIGLPEALSRTVAANPDLVAFGYQIEAAEGRLEQSAFAPSLELGVAVQDVLGNNAYRGVDSGETTVTLGWVLERGTRERIIGAARAGLSLREAEAEVTRLDAAAETARRFVACLAYQGRLRNAREAVAQAELTVRRVGERVAAGRSLEAELARAEADLVGAELLQEEYEHELLSAYHRLSAQWGDTEPDFAAVSGAVEPLPNPEPFEALLARVDDNPELASYLSQQRLDEAALRLAQAQSRPSWQVSGGLRRYEATDDLALVGGLTVPLPRRNRNQGRISEARAEMTRTQAETTASRVRIETDLFVFHQELNHYLRLAGRLTADVIPKLEQALEDTRRAYEVGRYGYSEWRIVQAQLMAANNELLEAGVGAHLTLIEIERLTGVRVAPAPTVQ